VSFHRQVLGAQADGSCVVGVHWPKVQGSRWPPLPAFAAYNSLLPCSSVAALAVQSCLPCCACCATVCSAQSTQSAAPHLTLRARADSCRGAAERCKHARCTAQRRVLDVSRRARWRFASGMGGACRWPSPPLPEGVGAWLLAACLAARSRQGKPKPLVALPPPLGQSALLLTVGHLGM